MMEARALCVERGGRLRPRGVLHDVSLQVERGEIVGVIGPAACGKTTLLKAIAGLLDLTSGRVAFDGNTVVDEAQTADGWQRRLGMTFENDALFDALSVFDNVAFPLRQRGAGEREVQGRVAQALADVGLADLGGLAPAQLSGGMRKRAGVARATVFRPDVGLFDEPIAGLDPATSAAILRLIVTMTRELRMHTLVVAHDLGALLPVCDRILMLCAGATLYDGPPEGLRASSDARVVQFATGSPEGPL